MDFSSPKSLLVAAAVLAPLVSVLALPAPEPAEAAVAPVPNPAIADTCGVDLTMVLDASAP